MKFIGLVLVVSMLFAFSYAREGSYLEAHPDHEVMTEHMAVELTGGVNADEVAAAHGYMNMGLIGSLPNTYYFHKLGAKMDVDIMNGAEEEKQAGKRSLRNLNIESEHPHISTSPHVNWFEPQLARKRFVRAEETLAPTDPLYNNQWHLHNPNTKIDINVQGAWDMGLTGEGVTIGVVDDGLQYLHPDIAPNYVAEGSYDFNYNDADPQPSNVDDHGTSAGGVAAARDNSNCGVGAAPRAGLSGIRLIASYTSDAQEASGLGYRYDINHIYTNSWGPNDDGKRLEGPGKLTQRVMENAVNTGRNGKGSIYVWAGGNGRNQGDNCNYDGYANSRFTITIGAVEYNGKQAYYSENCAALICSAPSSGVSGKAIVTSDLVGSVGTSPTECTSTFGGTSAAAPLVAGVVALMLQANPNLGWRDVQHILVNTSRPTDTEDAGWFTNGAGFRHNHKYGYGLIDASAAVSAARSHVNFGAYSVVVSNDIVLNTPIQDSTVSDIYNFTDTMIVETVEVTVTIMHPTRGSLLIELVSPFGTVSTLQDVHNDRSANINAWTYSTVRSWGERVSGSWKLQVTSKGSGSTGTWVSWQIRAYGHQ